MSESLLRVIVLPSLVYPYFELDIKQDEIRKALLTIVSNWMTWIILPLYANSTYSGVILVGWVC